MDWFLYSGDIKRGADLNFIEFVAEHKSSDEVCLILCTHGGAPDAAFKLGRYFQSRYQSFKILVPGLCKSAGTLLAIAADEIIFSPYGELGPLDIQMTKTDNLAGLESGLNIDESFRALENRAKTTFHDLVEEIMIISGGNISFQTASHAASQVVAALFGPITGRIDPEEVGSRARAMQIGEEYGDRLNQKYGNLQDDALTCLAQKYPSHDFVIDLNEANELFKQVREASDAEKALIDKFGIICRHPPQAPIFANLAEFIESETNEPKPIETEEPIDEKTRNYYSRTGRIDASAKKKEGIG